jgi:hypothetical protein
VTERVILTRIESSDQGTFGKIAFGGITLFTGELPWLENAANVSSIPTGIYPCRPTFSPRFKRQMILVDGVPDRTGVRIHSANFMGRAPAWRAQLNGCIAIGERLGVMDGQKALLLSAPAVRRFEAAMGESVFELEVRNGFSR